MIGKASNSQIRTVALGATVQSSTYGQTIPRIYGRCKSALYLIWAANLRQGASGKGAKKENLLGPLSKIFGIGQGYLENVDFLVGHNPILNALQFWVNQTQWLPLNFAEYSLGCPFIGPGSITIPDSLFYAVLGVTITTQYAWGTGHTGSVTFDDYGGQGPQTYSGSYEIPMWNQMMTGPNPTDPSGGRFSPYIYRWTPGDNVIYLPNAPLGNYPSTGYTINIYYAQLDPSGASLYDKKNSGTSIPIAALNMVFEEVLGNGPEYVLFPSNPAYGQRIEYPHYAGMSSVALDLGTSNNLPNLQPEIQGAFGLYSKGDADFADMIEDVFNGATQAGFSNSSPLTTLNHGLNCQNFPGPTQAVSFSSLPAFLAPATTTAWTYPLPNTAGNLLVVALASSGGSVSAISDTAGNTWTPAFGSPTDDYQVWTATANAYSVGGHGTTVTITWSWAGLPQVQGSLIEIAGVDTLSATGISFTNSVSVTSPGTARTPAYLFGFVSGYGLGLIDNPMPQIPNWNLIGPGSVYGFYGRVVNFPGTFTLTAPSIGLGYLPNSLALFCFTNSMPVSYAQPLGDILDHPTLDLVRLQCRAAGLWGSLSMDSQKAASDWLKDLYDAADAAPVWSGFVLKSIPYSEVSAVGNGAIYNAPTASGPLYNFKESDFITAAGEPPVTVERIAQLDVPDLLQIQQPSRDAQYNDVVVSEPETAAIALLGPRKASPVQMRMFQEPEVGRMYLGIQVRRENYLRNSYKFKLPARFKLLEAMALATLPLSATMPNSIAADGSTPVPTIPLPVRLTSVQEDDKFNLDCKAEDFIYGTNAPVALPVTAQQPNFPQTGASPASVNPPVIFEPVPRLNDGNLCLVVSDSDPIFGGAQIFMSVDGGLSYANMGSTVGSGTTGYLTADWPAAEDPDTTNDLAVDLTESLGTLESFSEDQEDNFVPVSYVSGTGAAPSFVQSAKGHGHNVTSLAVAFAADNIAGNAIVVTVGCLFSGTTGGLSYAAPPTLVISDSNGNEYTVAATTPPSLAAARAGQVWAFAAFGITDGGPAIDTITVTADQTVDLVMAIHEYADVNAVDGFAGASSAGSLPSSFGSGSADQKFNFDLLLGVAYDAYGVTTTLTGEPGGQWTARESVSAPSSGRGVLATFDGPSALDNDFTAGISGGVGPIHCLTLALTKVISTPQPGVVQSYENAVSNNLWNVTSCAAAFQQDITAGNAIVVSVGMTAPATVPTLSLADTLGNIYQLIGSSPFDIGYANQLFVYVAFASSGGANTVTVTASAGVFQLNVTIHEVLGIEAVVSPPALVDGFDAADDNGAWPLTQHVSVEAPIGDLLMAFAFGGTTTPQIYWETSPEYAQLTQCQTFYGGHSAAFAQLSDGPQSSLAVTTNQVGGGGSEGAHVCLVAFHCVNLPEQDAYELMSYAVATMTATNKYTLEATGGNELRRAVYGQPQPNQGDDHPAGSRFAYIGQGALGILKLNIDSLFVGQQLNFKFPAFNSFGGGLQSLADIPAYGYTIQGTSQGSNPNTSNYTVNPAEDLTNPTATTIDMGQCTVTFPSNAVNYNARTFTIPAPSAPIWYYVTIYDPGYVGDPDSTTDLAAQCQTDDSLVGAAGYTFIGAIIALPGGGGTTTIGGGQPTGAGELFLVNGT